jgi:hypothetical protein
LRTQEDKETLRQFKDDIFNEDIPTSRTINKYFKFATEVNTVNNIAYKNSTCEGVAKSVRSMLEKTYEYEVGEVLVCRKYLKGKFGQSSVNFEYVVKFTKEESIVLKDLHGTHSFELDRDVIKKHFIHSYCRTCHSFQGSSIDEKSRSSIGSFSS